MKLQIENSPETGEYTYTFTITAGDLSALLRHPPHRLQALRTLQKYQDTGAALAMLQMVHRTDAEVIRRKTTRIWLNEATPISEEAWEKLKTETQQRNKGSAP